MQLRCDDDLVVPETFLFEDVHDRGTAEVRVR
jgi:hypothetical protein